MPEKTDTAKVSWHHFSNPASIEVDPRPSKRLRGGSLWQMERLLIFNFCRKEFQPIYHRVVTSTRDIHLLNGGRASVQESIKNGEWLKSMQEVRLKHKVQKLEEDRKDLIIRTWIWPDKIEMASLINCFKFNQCFAHQKRCISYTYANWISVEKVFSWLSLNSVGSPIKEIV